MSASRSKTTRTMHIENVPIDLIDRARAKCAETTPPRYLKYVIRELLEDWVEGDVTMPADRA